MKRIPVWIAFIFIFAPLFSVAWFVGNSCGLESTGIAVLFTAQIYLVLFFGHRWEQRKEFRKKLCKREADIFEALNKDYRVIRTVDGVYDEYFQYFASDGTKVCRLCYTYSSEPHQKPYAHSKWLAARGQKYVRETVKSGEPPIIFPLLAATSNCD